MVGKQRLAYFAEEIVRFCGIWLGFMQVLLDFYEFYLPWVDGCRVNGKASNNNITIYTNNKSTRQRTL